MDSVHNNSSGHHRQSTGMNRPMYNYGWHLCTLLSPSPAEINLIRKSEEGLLLICSGRGSPMYTVEYPLRVRLTTTELRLFIEIP